MSIQILILWFIGLVNSNNVYVPLLYLAAVNKMIKEMIPNVRVSNDARELILNCCTGGYRSSNSFTLEHIYTNYH